MSMLSGVSLWHDRAKVGDILDGGDIFILMESP